MEMSMTLGSPIPFPLKKQNVTQSTGDNINTFSGDTALGSPSIKEGWKRAWVPVMEGTISSQTMASDDIW